jgi:hypothetical protein
MGFTQKVAVLDEASRNLNTSSWTVSGLKGDSNDIAFMAFCDSGSTASNALDITFNSDTGANYERYHMRGNGTSKGIGNLTSQNEINIFDFTDQDGSRNSLLIGCIRGDSSQDRVLTYINGSGNPRITQGLGLWTDNVNELNSITFTSELNASCKWHIVVWEVPKLNNNDNWELVDTLSWSASSTEQSFTGLAGDTDKFYKLLWDSQDTELNIEINNDATSSYKRELIRNNGSAFIATTGTDLHIRTSRSAQVLINAETGDERTSFSIHGGDSTDKQHIRGVWYTDTATEVTSLYCTPLASTTSEMKLFRAKYPQSSVPDMFDLPFKKVDSFSVNTADFTAGQSFSGLDGDNVLLYRLEFKGVTNASAHLRINGDSGASDYVWQYLNGSGTAEAAGSDTADGDLRWINDSDNKQVSAVMYIYPQSGEYRPTLKYTMDRENRIELASGWRLDTVTEITSILPITIGTAGTVNGTFTLSEIRL